MKRYKEYKNTGIEWVGEIPDHWNLKRIKHTTYVKGRIGWQGLRSDEFLEKGDSHVVTGTDFDCGRVNWETCYQITQSRYDEDPFIQLMENDLLITKDGTIGKIALVKNIPGIATLNSGIFVTRPKTNDYITEFMYWVLQSDVFTSFINHNKSGSTILHLYQNVFNEFSFPCPLVHEQTQIAQYLDHKTSQIDKLITDKEKLIELLNEERTAIINQAVTKGLNPEVPMKDSGIEWLGEVPEHWEVKKLKYLCSVISEKKDDFKPEVIIALENIESWTGRITGSLDINEVGSDLSLFRKGDVLFNKLRPYLAKAVLANHDGACVGELLVLRSTSEIMPEFLFRRMLSEIFISTIDGSTFGTKMPRASWDKFISKLAVPICGIDEQKEIVLFISNQEKRIYNLLEKIQQEIQLLKEYKTALISEVVTGKIDVRDKLLKPKALA